MGQGGRRSGSTHLCVSHGQSARHSRRCRRTIGPRGAYACGRHVQMISVDDAVARIGAAFAPLDAETIVIGKAAGRVLAADAIAGLNQPPSPVSSMDGYALRVADA